MADMNLQFVIDSTWLHHSIARGVGAGTFAKLTDSKK